MRALITRPQEDAADLAAALTDRGIEPLIEPLLQITPVAGASVDLDGVQAVLFTSANGVRAFASVSPRRDLPAYTVGDGSAAAAKLAGFTRIESAGGDVNALASLVCDRLKPEDGAVFHAAGSVTAGDLAGSLEGAGFTVRRVVLYEAVPATALSPETRMNLTLGGIDMVLLFSPRTATTFAQLWRQAGAPSLERICAICLSAAVAREVGDLSWRDVFIAERPDLPSLLALVDAELQRKDENMAETTSEASASAGSDAAAFRSDRTADGNAARGAADIAPTPRRSSGGGAGTVVASAVVAALVSGAVVIAAPRWQPLLGLNGATSSTDDVAKLQQDVTALSARQSDAPAKTDIAAALSPLQDEVATLKATVSDLSQRASAQGTANQGTANQGSADTSAAAPTVDLQPLADRVNALEATLTDLQGKVKAEAPASPAAPATDFSPEISGLKMENQALRDQITALSGKLDALDKDGLGKVDASLGTVSQRVASLEAQVAAAPAPVTARQQLATATVLAIGQLQNLIAGTQAFGGQLAVLKQLAGSDTQLGGDLNPILEKLAPIADSGAPTLSQLQTSLPATEIARAAEAEQAGSLAGDTSWWQRMTHRLAEIVTVRPVGEDVTGDGPLERLARAEAALKKGDLTKAAPEIGGLTGEPARQAAPWLAQAQARLTLDAASSQLSQVAARQLAPASGTGTSGNGN
ncbi:MAG TPA: uroporphyrinogen-III synthase [Dongiaceae bacterium]|nr:uroporphyrinogen-III synthase [Dongiaceae bacterium]